MASDVTEGLRLLNEGGGVRRKGREEGEEEAENGAPVGGFATGAEE